MSTTTETKNSPSIFTMIGIQLNTIWVFAVLGIFLHPFAAALVAPFATLALLWIVERVTDTAQKRRRHG